MRVIAQRVTLTGTAVAVSEYEVGWARKTAEWASYSLLCNLRAV